MRDEIILNYACSYIPTTVDVPKFMDGTFCSCEQSINQSKTKAYLLMEHPNSIVQELLNTIPQVGTVVWIGLRPGRKIPINAVDSVEIAPGIGLLGDRFGGTVESKRQVTFLQHEHLAVIEAIMGKRFDPAILRRNIMVKGINLLALHNRKFSNRTRNFRGNRILSSLFEDGAGVGKRWVQRHERSWRNYCPSTKARFSCNR